MGALLQTRAGTRVCVWRPKDDLHKSVLSFPHTALEIELELFGLVAKTFTHMEPSSLALAVISKNVTQCGTQQALSINL